jgi:hypothetical protein
MGRFGLFLPLVCMVLLVSVTGAAQEKLATSTRSTCSRESALTIIDRQIDLSKTIDNDTKRINLLIRAADLTWPFEQEKARATFTDAFDVASRLFKEKGAPDTKEGRSRAQGIDYRYTVITAIGKRDSAWARRLTKQILDEEAESAKEKGKDSEQARRTAERLLSTATSLIASDPQAALEFARSSLGYPASINLPFFFYKLWQANPKLGDQFYAEAVTAYAQAPMDQFLYLSSYPFAANREIGEMPIWTIYGVPSGFAPNPALQRLFVSTLLGRARALLQNPETAQAGVRWTENSQLFMALSRLEPLIGSSLPDLAGQLSEARRNIGALLTEQEQKRTADTMTDPPKRTFDETIESADKLANAAQREAQIALAVLDAAETESLEKLDAAGMKIDDVKLRSQVMSLVYFYRSQKVLKDKQPDEARRLAARVEEPDQRAYLYAKVAEELLRENKNDASVRGMLEEVVDAVAKAPDSEVKARAMLVVVHLYSTIDPNRAVALLGDVIKTVNHIESIDLTGDRINKRIEGKAFGTYRGLQTPGFSPEIVFREMGKLDFDGTLYLASNLNDKSVRGMTTLSLADQCLKDLPPPPKPTKPAAAKPR